MYMSLFWFILLAFCVSFSFYQRFGTHHLISLHYLEKVGLLKVQEGKFFPLIRRQLKLVTSVDEKVRKLLLSDILV